MDIFTSLVTDIEQRDKQVQSIIAATERVLAISDKVNRLGLLEQYETDIPVRKGDIVFDTYEKSVYVATGKYNLDGKPIVAGRESASKALEPEFVISGLDAADAAVREAANKLSSKFPDRRVLVYGALPAKHMNENYDPVTINGWTVKDKSFTTKGADPTRVWIIELTKPGAQSIQVKEFFGDYYLNGSLIKKQQLNNYLNQLNAPSLEQIGNEHEKQDYEFDANPDPMGHPSMYENKNETTSCGSKSEKLMDREPWCTWIAAGENDPEKGLDKSSTSPKKVSKNTFARKKK